MKTKLKEIKLGIDVHLKSFVVVMQEEGSNPKRSRRFASKEALLKWVGEQCLRAEQVHSCYEAGPFGYGLHRELTAMGVKNQVVCPQNWDERGKKVKTDSLDALALCRRLSQYVGGNHHAFSIVRVPTVEQEVQRQVSRHRERLKKHRQRVASQGRGILMFHGYEAKGYWWKGERWAGLQERLDPILVGLLAGLKELIERLEQMEGGLIKQLQSEAMGIEHKELRAKGMGGLTLEIIDREVGDWKRFNNRREVGSYTGLCPSENSSGARRQQGSVTKTGNALLRYYLVEMAWRLVRYQPDYPPVAKWRETLLNGTSSAKKKAIVAIARRMAVDLWRLRSGQTTLERLNLVAI